MKPEKRVVEQKIASHESALPPAELLPFDDLSTMIGWKGNRHGDHNVKLMNL